MIIEIQGLDAEVADKVIALLRSKDFDAFAVRQNNGLYSVGFNLLDTMRYNVKPVVRYSVLASKGWYIKGLVDGVLFCKGG